MSAIVGIVIALLIAGFVLFAGRKLLQVIAPYLDPVIAGALDIILVILAVAIVLFMAVIPLLHMLAGININVTGLH